MTDDFQASSTFSIQASAPTGGSDSPINNVTGESSAVSKEAEEQKAFGGEVFLEDIVILLEAIDEVALVRVNWNRVSELVCKRISNEDFTRWTPAFCQHVWRRIAYQGLEDDSPLGEGPVAVEDAPSDVERIIRKKVKKRKLTSSSWSRSKKRHRQNKNNSANSSSTTTVATNSNTRLVGSSPPKRRPPTRTLKPTQPTKLTVALPTTGLDANNLHTAVQSAAEAAAPEPQTENVLQPKLEEMM